MRTLVARVAAAWATSSLLAVAGFAAVTHYGGTFRGSDEVPPVTTTATGSAFLTVNFNQLTVSIVFTGLTGGNASAATLHCCIAPGSNTGVAILLPSFPGATSGSYTQTFDLTVTSTYNGSFLTASGGTAAAAEAALLAGLAAKQAYVNIHDAVNPGGEIRANLLPSPTLTTTAAAPVGAVLADTAHLTGGTNPTGTVTFTLYGPNDATCAGPPPATFAVTVNGNGDYTSDKFTAASPGTYRWIATYGGDSANGAVATSCNDPNESVTLTPVTPTLTTTAGRQVLFGPGGQPFWAVYDTAHLASGNLPTGTITFSLFGPNDATCGTVPQTETVPVDGNGDYASDFLTPPSPGTYRFIAKYNGDGANNPVTTACNDPGESVDTAVPIPVALVPALGSAGLAVLVLVLAALGLVALRR